MCCWAQHFLLVALGLQMKVLQTKSQITQHMTVLFRPAVSLHAGERGVPLKLGAADFPFSTASGVTSSSTVATCMQSSSQLDNSAQPLVCSRSHSLPWTGMFDLIHACIVSCRLLGAMMPGLTHPCTFCE